MILYNIGFYQAQKRSPVSDTSLPAALRLHSTCPLSIKYFPVNVLSLTHNTQNTINSIKQQEQNSVLTVVEVGKQLLEVIVSVLWCVVPGVEARAASFGNRRIKSAQCARAPALGQLARASLTTRFSRFPPPNTAPPPLPPRVRTPPE